MRIPRRIAVALTCIALVLPAIAPAGELPGDVMLLTPDPSGAPSGKPGVAQYLKFADLPMLGKVALLNDRNVRGAGEGYSPLFDRVFRGLDQATDECGVVTVVGFREVETSRHQELELKDFRQYHCKASAPGKGVVVTVREQDKELNDFPVMTLYLEGASVSRR